MSQKPGLTFDESMEGYFAEGLDDFQEGYNAGLIHHHFIKFSVSIHIDHVEEFIKLSGRKATLTGRVSCSTLGKNLEIKHGRFNLFQPSLLAGERRMVYSFYFTDRDGLEYYFYGFKIIYHDRGKIDLLEDMTTLLTRIYRLKDRKLTLFGSGILKYRLTDLPAMIASMRVTHCPRLVDQIRVKWKFLSFVYGEVRDTYLHDLIPLYFTAYENLVLSGHLSDGTGKSRFFFFSGIHDKDFPWGDKTTFWDMGLWIERANGECRRFALTNHRIENLMLDVQEGVYHYEGEIFELNKGHRVTFSQMQKSPPPETLGKLPITIDLKFNAASFPTQHVPFHLIPNYEKYIRREFAEDIPGWLSFLEILGLHLTPHRVTIQKGKILLGQGSEEHVYSLDQAGTLGEAEIASFNNIRWPTLYYNYFCAIDPASSALALHIRTGVLKEKGGQLLKDMIDGQLGRIIDHIAWLDLEIKEDKLRLLSKKEGDSFPFPKRTLLEIRNDHYPTAAFQRRIVDLGDNQFSLEEDMDALRLESMGSDREATVAAVKDHDKIKAFDRVLEMTGFFERLEAVRKEKGKRKDDFSILIKPNFMFMYSMKDRSTFTDPELIEHLASRIGEKGYRRIAVAEARSTYGMFFMNREVVSVAKYIGLDGICPGGQEYRIVDLSLDTEEYEFGGLLQKHCVNREWKEADFRISFAKNKTHAYAFYTLTIKNIYGALPKEDKFKEYHCDRDIFSTTIEFLKHFPVHFALIDAHLGADGPFGVFADKRPNYTETIIGGDDLVAVDWVGAAKMGLDPLVSGYMKQAVEAFGKPQIHLLGHGSLYRSWVNVPDVVSQMAFGLDREYYFGNFFYSVFSTMDPYFAYKEESTLRRVARVLTDPIRSLFFERVRQGVIDLDLSNKLYRLYTGNP